MQMSMSKEDLDYDRFMSFGPSHNGASTVVEVKTMILPNVNMVQIKQVETPCSSVEQDLNDICEDFNSQTYEHIVATAVRSKTCEEHPNTALDRETSEQGGAGTDTDSGLSGSLKGEARKGVALRRYASGGLSEGETSPPNKLSVSPATSNSPDIGVGMDNGTSTDTLWNYEEEPEEEEEEGGRGEEEEEEVEEYSPVQFKIEEHIEEVTTHRLTDFEDQSSSDDSAVATPSTATSETDPCPTTESKESWQNGNKVKRRKHFASKMSSSVPQNLLPAFDLPSINGASVSNYERVPFPEFGVDLLQGPSTAIDGGPSEHVMENLNWKENWLFRSERNERGRGRGVQSFLQSGPSIGMLIPNPAENVGPTIGNRDIDELSELSDRDSSFSFDFSSSDDTDYRSAASSAGGLPQPPLIPSGDLLQLVDEISTEFCQKDQEYLEDVSVLDRLTLSGTREARMDTTGDLVYDSRLVYKSDDASKRGSQAAPRKYRSACSVRPLCVPLNPPLSGPHDWDDAPQVAPSVWFESLPRDEAVPVGRVLRLSCQVRARNTCRVSWYLNDVPLGDGGGSGAGGTTVMTWRNGDVHVLNVFDMCARTCGMYAVCAYTKSDCVWARCQATCTDAWRANKIPRITLTLCDVVVEEGDDVTLECQVSGHPEPKVTFVRDNLTLTPASDPNIYIENDQYGAWCLRLGGVRGSDAGRLKAVASNALGHAMTSCDLEVLPEGQKDRFGGDASKREEPVGLPAAAQNSRKKKKSSNQAGHTKNATSFGNNNNNQRPYNNNISKSSSSNINASTAYQTNNRYSNNYSNNNHNSNYYYYEDNCVFRGDDEGNKDVVDGSQDITINGYMFQPPKPGTIAEREHRKWLEAKPLPNNPYSPEKLAFRLGQSPTRFPSLPAVYKETCDQDEEDDTNIDPSLRNGLVSSSSSDLSRYSRDYHVYGVAKSKNKKYIHSNAYVPVYPGTKIRSTAKSTSCLVTVEPQKSADWKEELKDIKLNVGQKVADLQKTIDAFHHDWKRRLHQKGGGTSHISRRHKQVFPRQKLSASCINLTSPATPLKNTKPFLPSASSAKARHLIYSSTEALNAGKQQKDLWRTVSVDTLNAPLKFSMLSSGVSIDNEINSHSKGFDSKESIDGRGEQLKHTFSGPPPHMMMTDSDDSSLLNNTPYSNNNNINKRDADGGSYYGHQNGYANRRIASYYSENSVDSFKEESDTEGSLFAVDPNPNLPSVKQLASKFDSLKSSRNRTSVVKKRNHEKSLRSSRNQDMVIIEHQDQNSSIAPPSHNSQAPYSRKYNNKIAMNEVHHSLTARSVSKSFREGLRTQAQKTQTQLEPLTDHEYQLNNQECQLNNRDYPLNQQCQLNQEYQLKSGECQLNNQEYHTSKEYELNQGYELNHPQEYQPNNQDCHLNNQRYHLNHLQECQPTADRECHMNSQQQYHLNHMQECHLPKHTAPEERTRDTSSPEHLGIPSSPASIPTRGNYSYPPPGGDTSDDSMVAGLTPRKNYRKKNYSSGRS